MLSALSVQTLALLVGIWKHRGLPASPAADRELVFVAGVLLPVTWRRAANPAAAARRRAGWGSSNCKRSSSEQMLVLN